MVHKLVGKNTFFSESFSLQGGLAAAGERPSAHFRMSVAVVVVANVSTMWYGTSKDTR